MVYNKIAEIIVREAGVDPSKLSLEVSLESLQMDSLDAVSVIMAIETEYNIEISDDAYKQFSTIGDIVKAVEGLIKK